MIGNTNIVDASEQYHIAVKTCGDVFAAGGRQFVEPKGVQDLIQNARKLYSDGNEAAAAKEVDNARKWLNGILAKRLRGGVEFYEGKIREWSFMSLDQDIMDNMSAKLRDFCAALMLEGEDSFELRVETYCNLAAAVNGARIEQSQRNEQSERLAHEQVQRKEEERRERRRQQELETAETRRQEEEAKAAARAEREKHFDQLFG